MICFISFPILCFFLFLWIGLKMTHSWAISFIIAAIIWAVIVTLITEVLSLFQLITFTGLAVAWASVMLLSIAINIFFRSQRHQARPPLSFMPPQTLFTQECLAIGLTVAFISTIGVIALIAPPNTWDSAAYHMARVVHWIQNHNVNHYPTVYLNQLYQMPWAEFAIMHFQVLSGSDRFANCIQWWSMVGSLIGVFLIAKLLGASIRGQIFSVVVAVTIPMGILQASSTQNDYIVTFWLVCFAFISLKWLTMYSGLTRMENWFYVIGVGSSLGLALLTKGTAYIYGLPFIIWVGVVMLKQMKSRALLYGFFIAILALLINVGHYNRNIGLFYTPIYASPSENLTNQVHNLSAFISNVIRNISLHVGTRSKVLNAKFDRKIRRVHDIIGISVDDPRTTSWGNFRIHNMNTFEDTAGNPVHLVLVVISIIICLLWKTLRSHYRLISYLLVIMAAFFLFCVLLRWQSCNSRLQLPLFVLFSPFVGFILERLNKRRLEVIVLIGLFVTALPWLCFNKTRPLLPAAIVLSMREPDQSRYETIWSASRADQYFRLRESRALKESYLEAATFLRSNGFVNIGLWLPYDAWEYQLWVLLQADSHNVHLEHVLVTNMSGKLKIDEFIPSAIIHVRDVNDSEKMELTMRQGRYVRQWSKGLVEVFVKCQGSV